MKLKPICVFIGRRNVHRWVQWASSACFRGAINAARPRVSVAAAVWGDVGRGRGDPSDARTLFVCVSTMYQAPMSLYQPHFWLRCSEMSCWSGHVLQFMDLWDGTGSLAGGGVSYSCYQDVLWFMLSIVSNWDKITGLTGWSSSYWAVNSPLITPSFPSFPACVTFYLFSLHHFLPPFPLLSTATLCFFQSAVSQ